MIIRQNVQGLQSQPVEPGSFNSGNIEGKDMVRQIYMDEKIEEYILDIVFATRNPENSSLIN